MPAPVDPARAPDVRARPEDVDAICASEGTERGFVLSDAWSACAPPRLVTAFDRGRSAGD